MKNLISQRYSLIGAMKSAIKNNELYIANNFFDQVANQIPECSVEILLRWQDNQDQLIMPDFFIEEAEATGLIIPITLQIVEIAFSETKQILKNNPQFHLAVNICALHFIDPHFFTQFNDLIKQYEISPSQILLEITERDLLDQNNNIFLTKMKELRKSGFSLAIDDYGTGHASISYIQNFPFNFIKIDKLFIQAIGTHAITESLNHTIINMAKQLNLTVIAEGVETKQQVDFLSENGVRFMQGWYFSRAITIEELTCLLEGDQNEAGS